VCSINIYWVASLCKSNAKNSEEGQKELDIHCPYKTFIIIREKSHINNTISWGWIIFKILRTVMILLQNSCLFETSDEKFSYTHTAYSGRNV
jgi:hypothetical protein